MPVTLSFAPWETSTWRSPSGCVVTGTGQIDEQLPDQVIVDLREVTFMDSSGLSLLAGVAKRQLPRGGRVAMCQAPPQVRTIMTLTRLNMSVQILTECPDLDAAAHQNP